jgi:hypothetical protein
MKSLPIRKEKGGSRASVDCAGGEVSVYRNCAFCEHCRGVRLGPRTYPAPQEQAYRDLRRGAGSDEALMNAAMQFNQLVMEGEAIECDDDANTGFHPRYRL